MLGIFFVNEKTISKEKKISIIKNNYSDFKTVDEILSYKRLQTWFHFSRNHKNDPRNIFNYCPSGPTRFSSCLTLAKTISKDALKYPNYIPRFT
jgi:hypothetical protein